jgi:hypothetical protein
LGMWFFIFLKKRLLISLYWMYMYDVSQGCSPGCLPRIYPQTGHYKCPPTFA